MASPSLVRHSATMPTIRPSTGADLAAIVGIYRPEVLHGSASFELTPPEEAEMGRRRAAVLALELPYLVAEIDGAVVAYAYAGPYHARPGYRFTVEDSIYVASDARGRGVGGALLRELIARCEAWGARRMIAVIGDSANAASIALHARAGFRSIGCLPAVGWKHGRWLDSVLMQRALGEGEGTAPE